MPSPALSSLLVRWEEAFERGEDLSAEQLCPDQPHLATALARAIDGLRQMRRLEAESAATLSLSPQAAWPETVLPANGEPSTDAYTLGPRGDASSPFLGSGPPGYEILGELGRGGMGVVYKARQQGLNRVVALKMILAGGHADVEEKSRFLAEAEAIAKIKHPGIVQVFDFGTHDGLPFFSLEFCAGGSLAGKLRGKPLPPSEAALIVEQIARGAGSACCGCGASRPQAGQRADRR